jgi:hypothetical protein
MAKKDLKIVLVSFFLLLHPACKTTPTYSQKNIEQIIERLCEKEFNLEAKAWLVENTLWVYVPFGKILDRTGKPKDSFSENTRRIFLALQRTFLNMNNPPKFYCFVLSDIKDKGIDVYRIGSVRDLIKLRMNLISLEEFNQRMVFLSFENKEALGDKQGKHIARYNITLGDFIGYLAQQKLKNIFSSYSEETKVERINSYYQKGELGIRFDIGKEKTKQNISAFFLKAKEVVKEYLEIYNRPDEIVEIKIRDNSGNESIFTQASLFN